MRGSTDLVVAEEGCLYEVVQVGVKVGVDPLEGFILAQSVLYWSRRLQCQDGTSQSQFKPRKWPVKRARDGKALVS